jgi:mono/diheme cytochrome c family protein
MRFIGLGMDMNFTRIAFLALAALPVALLVLGGKAPQAGRANASLVKRGEYLVRFGGCSDCHTPKRMTARGVEEDLSRHLAGHPGDAKLPPPPALPPGPWSVMTAGSTAWSGPWGVSYASNLTPDVTSGMGLWTEEMFLKAMRAGKHYGVSRDILPPMRWQGLAGLTDEDLKAIYAYLRSIPPVKNRVPDPLPPAGSATFD